MFRCSNLAVMPLVILYAILLRVLEGPNMGIAKLFLHLLVLLLACLRDMNRLPMGDLVDWACVSGGSVD
jgi:hypothetical protein